MCTRPIAAAPSEVLKVPASRQSRCLHAVQESVPTDGDAHLAEQAMARLLMANIHAPDQRPIVTLTDLQRVHIFFWLDGHTINFYRAPDAATAWALTRAVLKAQGSEEGNGSGSHCSGVAEEGSDILQQITKRQKLEVQAGSMEWAQLADIADSLDPAEVKASQAAILVRQLLALPGFASKHGSAVVGF